MRMLKRNDRSGLFCGSNVTFDPKECLAVSYGWWIFVQRIRGKVVFNPFSYSNTTVRHQYKVRQLLTSLGVEIDYYISAPRGLQDLDSAISYYENEIASLREEIEKPRTHERKNAERRSQIKLATEKIQIIQSLQTGRKFKVVK